MRHKRILDTAERNPDAPLEAIADEIPSATVELVEQVLDEYGDPGADDGSADATVEDGSGQASATDQNTEEGQPVTPPAQASQGDGAESEERVADQRDDEAGTSGEEADDSEAAAGPLDSDTDEIDGINEIDGADEMDGTDEAGSAEETSNSEEPAGADEAPDSEESLSTDERALLRAIHEYPGATQRELSGRLGVSPATVNRRVDAVDGLEWSDRQTFIQQYFDSDSDVHTTESSSATTNGAEPGDNDNGDAQRQDGNDEGPALDALQRRVAKLEEQLETVAETERTEPAEAPEGVVSEADTPALSDDPDLAHRVVHACMQNEEITEDEERRILREMME